MAIGKKANPDLAITNLVYKAQFIQANLKVAYSPQVDEKIWLYAATAAIVLKLSVFGLNSLC